MRVGVVFFDDGAWLHCGLTNGVDLIDSYPGVGVSKRPLPANHAGIHWLSEADGAKAWHQAELRLGDRFEICAAFVCQCLGTRCILPTTLARKLESMQ